MSYTATVRNARNSRIVHVEESRDSLPEAYEVIEGWLHDARRSGATLLRSEVFPAAGAVEAIRYRWLEGDDSISTVVEVEDPAEVEESPVVELADAVGRTVAAVASERWQGRNTFGDEVRWDVHVLTFTDGTSTRIEASGDGEVYDARPLADDDEDLADADEDAAPRVYDHDARPCDCPPNNHSNPDVDGPDCCKECGEAVTWISEGEWWHVADPRNS